MTRALVTGAAQTAGPRDGAVSGGSAAMTWRCITPALQTEADDVVDEIRAMGRRAVALQADLLDEAQTQALLPQRREALGGPITCLINNASIFEYDSVETATRDSWDRHLESNLRAPFVLTQAMAAQVPEPR